MMKRNRLTKPVTHWRPAVLYDLGTMAARMLVGLLHGIPSRPHQVILPSQIIARESTLGA